MYLQFSAYRFIRKTKFLLNSTLFISNPSFPVMTHERYMQVIISTDVPKGVEPHAFEIGLNQEITKLTAPLGSDIYGMCITATLLVV